MISSTRGSFCIAQRWVHDLKYFNSLSLEDQENTFGRTKDDSTKLPTQVPTSHLSHVELREGATADEEALREFCRGKIAHYKVPRHIKLVSELPMTVTGKVQKYKMREQAIAELGLQETATA